MGKFYHPYIMLQYIFKDLFIFLKDRFTEFIALSPSKFFEKGDLQGSGTVA